MRTETHKRRENTALKSSSPLPVQRSYVHVGMKHYLIRDKVREATVTIGGFPMEINTKIRYLKICCYHIFLPYKIMITTMYKICCFSFNFDRKSTI